MGSLLVAVFDDEAAARAGAVILRDLHATGALTLYARAIILRRPRSAVLSVRYPVGRGAAAAAPTVGAATGALVTLLGAPLAAASRTVTSGLVGAVRDLDEAGFDAPFLEGLSRHFPAGGGALIAETEEERQLPLDAGILSRGGRIFRHRLLGTLTEERLVRELTTLRGELRRLCMEPDKAALAETRARIRQDRLLELERLVARTSALSRGLRGEAAAKVAVLRAQAARLEGAARRAVEARATTVRSDLEARAARLDRSLEAGMLPRAAAPSGRAGSGEADGDS